MAARTRGRGKGKKEVDAPLAKSETGTALVPANRPEVVSNGPIATLARQLEGGKFTFMDLAQLAPEIDPKVAPVIEGWNKLTEDAKKKTNLDEVCRKLKMDPFHFLAVVAEAAIKFRDNASVIMAGLSLPNIVEKSVAVGLTDEGWRDRRMMMQHSGFLPAPKGATFVNTFAARLEANQEVNTQSSALPSFEKTVEILEAEDN